MNTGYINKLSLGGISPASSFQSELTGHVRRVQSPEGAEGVNFKSALGNMLHDINDTVTAPDALMHNAMTTGSVDVHDVMVANAKAELVVNVTAQVATKVVQAYDRILQIQI
jgi:flagellar hook-basal body complex protein FliE